MKLLKHITAFTLMAVLLLPLVTPAVLQVKQLYVQQQMEEALEKKELTHISVLSTNIQWIKKGKECLIEGEMFDVKHAEYSGDTILLTGLYDAKEKAIKQQLNKQAKEQQQQQSTKLVKLLLQTAVAAAGANSFSQTVQLVKADFPLYTLSLYNSLYCGCNTPPPRLS